ncbi:unnamed protein product, partial [marine sediment metagenome]
MEELRGNLITLALVTDPFGEYDENFLRLCFQDVVIPFKEHYVVDLSQPIDDIVSKHHRYYARKALNEVQVQVCTVPSQFTEEWIALYDNLIERHEIKGIKAFSRTIFEEQLNMPGLIMLRAVHQNIGVGAQLWFSQEEVGYNHLTAISETGYGLYASYALQWYATRFFSDKVRWLDLGG